MQKVNTAGLAKRLLEVAQTLEENINVINGLGISPEKGVLCKVVIVIHSGIFARLPAASVPSR